MRPARLLVVCGLAACATRSAAPAPATGISNMASLGSSSSLRPRPTTPRDVVERTLAALADGDSAAVLALMATTRDLREYVECRTDAQGRSASVRWQMLELISEGEVTAAAEALKGQGLTFDDYGIEFLPLEANKIGDEEGADCWVTQPYTAQEVELTFYIGSDDDDRMTLSLNRLRGRWRLVFLKFGRGYNN